MPGSRNKVPVYIIMVKDLNFGCIELVLSYSMDAAGIADCLRKMSYQLGVKILLVTTDAQPSYTSSNLNPDVEEGKLFGDCVFKRNVTHGQRRNLAESGVDAVKKVWSKIMQTDKEQVKHKLEALTWQEMETLLALVSLVCNMSPYSPNSDSVLCPGSFRYILRNVEIGINEPDGTVNGVKSLKEAEERLEVYTSACMDEMKNMVLDREDRYRRKHHADPNSHQRTGWVANVDDIVMVPTINGQKRLGVITKVWSPQTVSVRTNKGTSKRMSAELHPILHLNNRYNQHQLNKLLFNENISQTMSYINVNVNTGVTVWIMLMLVLTRIFVQLDTAAKPFSQALHFSNYIKVKNYESIVNCCIMYVYITNFVLTRISDINILIVTITQYAQSSLNRRSSLQTKFSTSSTHHQTLEMYPDALIELMPSSLTFIIISSLVLVDTATGLPSPGGFHVKGAVGGDWWKEEGAMESVSHNRYLTVDFIENIFSRVTSSIQTNLQAIGNTSTSNSHKILVLTASLMLVIILGLVKVVVEHRMNRKAKRTKRQEMKEMPSVPAYALPGVPAPGPMQRGNQV